MSADLYKRYAMALVELAEDNKALKKVESDMADLRAMLSSGDDFKAFISHAQISKSRQMDALKAVVKKAKLQGLTQNFLGILVENSRLNMLPAVIDAFFDALSQRRGSQIARVQVTQDLTVKQKKDLQAVLSKAVDGDVALDIQITPEILGGMIVTLGSTMIDDSTARKLERLKMNMAQKVAA